jgi:putative transposase
VQNADLQPTSDAAPDHIAVDKTVIQVNDERRWLYATVDPETSEFPHIRLFLTRTTQLAMLFLRELQQIVPITHAAILVDNVHHLEAALSRLGLRFQMRRHGNRNAVERVLREVKRRTYLFSNTFSYAQPTTAERWLQVFVVWWNHAQVDTTERLFCWLIYSLSANDINSAIRVSASSRRISVRFRPSGNSTPSTARTSCVS